MKEKLNVEIKVRTTASKKVEIDAYCAKYGITMSEFLRQATDLMLGYEPKVVVKEIEWIRWD